MKVFVLWEDRAVGPVQRFGPHTFLSACVAQQLGLDRFAVSRSFLGGRACSGNANVLRQLQDPRPWDDAEHVVAVLDGDKLHDLLGLPGSVALRLTRQDERAAWFRERDHQLRNQVGDRAPARLSIHILDDNLETLLEVLDGPVRRKAPPARDQILHRAAADPGLIRKAMVEMPSWAALVESDASRLRPT